MSETVLCVFIVAGWMCLTFLTIYAAKGGLRRKIKVKGSTEEKVLSKLHNIICNEQKDQDGWDVLRVKDHSGRIYRYCVDLTSGLHFWISRDKDEKCVEISLNGNISYKTKQVVFKTTDKRAHQIMDELMVRYELLKEWSKK